MSNNLENKVSHSIPPYFSKLQLKDLKYVSPSKQMYTVFNPDTEETMLMNFYQLPNSNANYEATVTYNELLVALAVKQKAPQHSFAITTLKLLERSDPIHEYSSTLNLVAAYKFREVASLSDILSKQMIEWNEHNLLLLLDSLFSSLIEISKSINFQQVSWILQLESIYFDLTEKRFLVQVEPFFKTLETSTQKTKFEDFISKQSIDLKLVQDVNLIKSRTDSNRSLCL